MAKISTRHLAGIPDISTLQKLCRSLATLDAIICPEWEYRYYSYDKNWDKDRSEEHFQMRNGSGDEFHILFALNGAIINGQAHESEMCRWIEKEIAPSSFREKIDKLFGKRKTTLEQQIWKGVVDDVPKGFREFIFGEPIRSTGTTFCIWREIEDNAWKIGDIEFPKGNYGDGSAELLYIFDGNPSTYKKWASQYYEESFEEHKLKLDLVKHIYASEPLTQSVVLGLNPNIDDWGKLKTELNEIGYQLDF